MDIKKPIKHSLNLASMTTGMLLADLDDDALFLRPIEGMNHYAWQLGHLILSEAGFVDKIRPGASPKLPEGFAENHASAMASSDDRSKFLTKKGYEELFAAQRAATLEVLDSLSDAELETPSPENWQQMAPTWADLFILSSTHEFMHSGQLSAVRRKLGKPAAF